MAYKSNKEYRQQIKESLNDAFLQKAMSNFTGNFPKSREKAFEGKNIDSLIEEISLIKKASVFQMSELYTRFKKIAESNGVKVYLAKDSHEANRIIGSIASENGVKNIIKSKSMTSEEIHLNKYLIGEGLNVVETDLGEWIIQLRGEGPSHMVMPAIHLSKEQVADNFSEVTKQKQPNDIDRLVKVARHELRQKFIDAEMGITGANIAIAETGTITLVTNEGNARLTSTLPKIHVALIGLEKLVPSIEDALKIINILPKNATGQNITSYVTWITGRNENKLTPDGRSIYHIVFLDNGRSSLSKDPVFSEILHCIRCGACANVCPVYGAIGGHKMGHTYIGPVGLVLTYFYHGVENARHLVDNCINCQACAKICASRINLPDLIKEVQIKVKESDNGLDPSKMVGRLMKNRKLFHSFLKAARIGQKPFKGDGQFLRHLPNLFFIKDQSFKTLPALAPIALRDEWEKIAPTILNPALKVGIFAGCLHDFVYPEQVKATLHLFAEHKIAVDFPKGQNCCGLPLLMNGDKKNTKAIVRQNVKAFARDYDYILTLCASCASFLKEGYPKLVTGDGPVKEFSSRIIDFSSFLNDVIKVDPQEKTNKKAAYHAPCHLCRGLNVTKAPRELIGKAGYEYVPTDTEETCCGFGGTYSMKFPEISGQRMNKKLDSAKNAGVDVYVTDCPGCIMQLRGGADKRNDSFSVIHIAELFKKQEKDD
ncbi:MAG: 4Fe-4S dicluster domain-containing protein [Bacteroidales bacterium]|nr:MAG: 4Fe-4S dicluster domain-containing protein [Bacteroidales bacterium]